MVYNYGLSKLKFLKRINEKVVPENSLFVIVKGICFYFINSVSFIFANIAIANFVFLIFPLAVPKLIASGKRIRIQGSRYSTLKYRTFVNDEIFETDFLILHRVLFG